MIAASASVPAGNVSRCHALMSGSERPVRARALAASAEKSTPVTSGSNSPEMRPVRAPEASLTSSTTSGSTVATEPSEATSRVVDGDSAPARISACLS